jgi:hypothetical protein
MWNRLRTRLRGRRLGNALDPLEEPTIDRWVVGIVDEFDVAHLESPSATAPGANSSTRDQRDNTHTNRMIFRSAATWLSASASPIRVDTSGLSCRRKIGSMSLPGPSFSMWSSFAGHTMASGFRRSVPNALSTGWHTKNRAVVEARPGRDGDRHRGFFGSDARVERSSLALQRAGPRRSAEQNFGCLEQKATDHSVPALGHYLLNRFGSSTPVM